LLHGATNGAWYLITSTDCLDPMASTWLVEGSLQATNDPTPFTLGTALRTNNLFIRAQGCDDCATTTLPLAWQLANFGVTGVPAGGDWDNDSVDNLTEFLQGTDPNKIRFSVSVDNEYVNFNPVPVQLSVSAGVPASISVLVDSTNFATASWTGFNPNPTVNLGANQGWHDVRIGLRGLPDTSQETWQWLRLKLDYTPPVLCITNPVTIVGSQPVIQVQGYCPEPLASLSCAISNALTLATNQTAIVLDQYYDRLTGGFTTNYFQIFDLQLTNGLNTITLHATDLAGNETITNFSFTLDYTGKTNPAVQIAWPQDGMAVSGSDFTFYGYVDDPTVSVLALVIDTDGNTNIFAGEVERTGRFWVDHLPLTTGTNPVSIHISNAVGLATVTDLKVTQSTMSLAIVPLADDSVLWQPTVDLTLTASNPNATVTVNGMTAVNNSDGTWSATGVPTTPGGVAIFHLSASVPGLPPANALSVWDKPARVYVAEDHLYNNSYGYDANVLYGDVPTHVSHQWLAYQYDVYDAATHPGIASNGGASMEYLSDNGYLLSAEYQFSYPDIGQAGTSIWLNPPDPIYQNFTTNTLVARPTYWRHVAEGWQLRASSFFIGNAMWPGTATCFNNMGADTIIHLQTGGRNGSTRQNLFCLSGSATARTNSPMPFFEPMPDPDQMPGPPDKPVPPGQIQVGGGVLGSDGNRWVVLPDGQDLNITPRVKGNFFYTFTTGAQKYKLQIVANNAPLAEDRIAPLANFTVGQRIDFYPHFTPSLPEEPQKTVKWSLAPTFINAFTVWVLDYDTSFLPFTQNVLAKDETYYDQAWGMTNFRVDDLRLQQEETFAWWLTGSETNYQADPVSVAMLLTFSNGQSAYIAGKGLIGMHKPTVAWTANQYSPGVIDGGWLVYGVLKVGSQGFVWGASSKSITNGAFFGMTQLLTRQSNMESWSGWRLDASIPYDAPSGYGGIHAPYQAAYVSGDNPFVSDPLGYNAYCTDAFKQYFMYRRNTPGSIWVTLGTSSWGWHGDVMFDAGAPPDDWSWVDSPSFTDSQNIQPTTELPQWKYVRLAGY
ncbi:MAG: hypothetical protein WCK27_27915, partial [Verrucomicrobiota bacterium]